MCADDYAVLCIIEIHCQNVAFFWMIRSFAKLDAEDMLSICIFPTHLQIVSLFQCDHMGMNSHHRPTHTGTRPATDWRWNPPAWRRRSARWTHSSACTAS